MYRALHKEGEMAMKCELSEEEVQFIEKYRDLLPEFQTALDKQAKVLFDLQTEIVKEMISKG